MRKLAAGLIVRRRSDGAVLVGARTDKARSWPGILAFPGGSADDDDHLLPIATTQISAEHHLRGCCLREAFEEAGVAVFAHRDGRRADMSVVDDVSRRVRAGARLIECLQGSDIVLDDRALVALGAWPTTDNSWQVSRYLWMVDEPIAMTAAPTDELCAVDYRDPKELVAGWHDGSVFFAPPMRIQLLRLAALDGASSEHDTAQSLMVPPDEGERVTVELIRGVVVIDPKTPTLWPATTTNCSVLGCGDVLLVDPATPYPDERDKFDAKLAHALSRGSRRVQGIVLTHHHHDHIGDVTRLRTKHGCPVYAHKETAARVANDGIDVDVVIDEGYEFLLDGAGHGPSRRFVALHTPGHAAGHICLWEPSLRLLIAGDMVASTGSILIDPDEGHMATYLHQLRRLVAFAPRSLMPAHGPLITDGVARLEQQIAHRLMREALVNEVVQAGAESLSDIVERVYTNAPAAMLPFAERSALAILHKLVEDGAVTPSERGWRPMT